MILFILFSALFEPQQIMMILFLFSLIKNDNPYFNDKDFYMGFVNNSNSKDNINSIICDVVLKVKRKYNFTDLSRNNFLTSPCSVHI